MASDDIQVVRYSVKGMGMVETLSRPGTGKYREILNGDGRWLPSNHPNVYSIEYKGRWRGGVRVKGRVTDHACNATCLNATGPNCDCSCGGKNHGAGVAIRTY